MSYFLTEEQVLIQKAVHQFCQNPETQKAIATDNQTPGYPWHSWKALVKQGFVGISIPEEYGGQGHTYTTELVVNEALGCYGFPALESMAGHALGMSVLEYWGTEEQKKKYLPGLASGELLCCGAATDPAGSMNTTEWGLTYKEEGDSYVLNGTKVLVTNAHASDIKIVFGQSSEDGGVHLNKAFIIEKGTPGMETGYQEARVVPGPCDWGSISLKNVRVSKANVMQDNGFGCKWNALGFNAAALMVLGLGMGAFQMAFKYTSQRTNSGRPLTALQSVSHRLVDMAVSNETSKCLIFTAARLWDEKRYDESMRLAYMAKVYVGEAMQKVVHDATVLHGGLGFSPKSIIGMLNAGVVAAEIAEGCPDILRDFVAQTYGIEPVWKKGRP